MHVICHETITSPAPPAGFLAAFAIEVNAECGSRCPIINRAPQMHVMCPLGHQFIAEQDDIMED